MNESYKISNHLFKMNQAYKKIIDEKMSHDIKVIFERERI